MGIKINSGVTRTIESAVGATLMKTGQTTSYRTGDDGDLETGRATDFFTLDAAPLHNDGTATINTTTNRFTDTLGGSTYANDWVLDWSTWNGSTLLGYYRVVQGLTTWDNGIDDALGTFGGYSGGRMWNRVEALNILNHEVATARLNYLPFNYSTNTNFMTSTTQPLSTTNVFGYQNTTGLGLSRAKTSTSGYIVVRTFSLSTLNVLS